jgi:hypothetical protein
MFAVVGDDYHECSRVVIENEQQQEEVKAMDATSSRRQQRIRKYFSGSLLEKYYLLFSCIVTRTLQTVI